MTSMRSLATTKSNQRFRAVFVGARLLASGLALLALAGCRSNETDVRATLAARTAVSAAMENGPTYLLAGVSTDAMKKVTPFDSASFDGRMDTHQFHAFKHRCGACHLPPEPRMHRSYEWEGVVGQMERTIGHAGLLPIAPADRAMILDFLTQHASRAE